jgi:hypothetical protein
MTDDETTSQHATGTADRPEPSDPAGPAERAVVTGRPAGAPFLLLGGVALAIWAVVAVLAVGLLVLWWLA